MIANVLTIAGSDPSGGACIQADLKTFSALGAYGATVVTALTAQNTRGVRSFQVVEASFVADQIDAIYDDVRIDAVKIGMVATAEIAAVIAQRLAHHRARNVVLDPVMVAKSGDRLLAEDAVVALRDRLVPIAELITPNLPASLGQDASRFCTPARACCRASSAGRVGAWGSLDHFVGAGEQRWRHGKAKRLGGVQVDHKLIFRRRLYWQVSGTLPLENAINIGRGPTHEVNGVDTIGHQTTVGCLVTVRID